MNLTEKMHDVLITALVQKKIFCEVTGNLLDKRTCAVLLDTDGDPAYVCDPSVKARMDTMNVQPNKGYTWMDRS